MGPKMNPKTDPKRDPKRDPKMDPNLEAKTKVFHWFYNKNGEIRSQGAESASRHEKAKSVPDGLKNDSLSPLSSLFCLRS